MNHYQGTYADDHLIGTHYNGNLDGKAGDDVLLGGDGDDALFGGDGRDNLSGGKGDDHLIGGDFPLRLAIPRCQADRVGIDKHRVRFPKLNAVAAELVADDVNFIADHPIGPEQKVRHCDICFDRIGSP